MSITKEAVQGLVEGVGSGLDGLFTSDEERMQAENNRLKIITQPHILQALNNIEDSKAKTLFQSGWRPALGWMCSFCLLYHFFLKDAMLSLMVVFMDTQTFTRLLPYLPRVDAGELMTLTLALLGLGGMRTYEKFKGINGK